MRIKTLTFLLPLMLVGVLSVKAQSQEWLGKTIKAGDNATSLQTGKWYLLYNASTQSYTKEESGKTLVVTSVSPIGADAESAAGYLVQLEDAGGEGKYYLKSGLGNYYRYVNATKNNGTEATAGSTSFYTIAQFEDEGHWSLRSYDRYYLQSKGGSLFGASNKGAVGGNCDWAFREVTFEGSGKLEGSAYVKYMLNKGGLIRITNRRTNTSNLTDNGTQTLGAKVNKNTLQQVWILAKKGEGYTLRNASTGRYLSSDNNYRSPSVIAKTLYIQYSPNNSGKTSYINVSEKSDFSGSSCLNLNGDGVNLYKWSYQSDPGSDWTISEVENYSLEEVQAALLAQSSFKKPEEGKYYRIRNMGYDTYMTEDFAANTISCESKNTDKLSQYWTLVSSGTANKFFLQNLCTERYITRQGGSLSTQYKTQVNKTNASFTISRTDDTTNLLYYIVDNGNVALHCDAQSSVVGWYTNNIPGSTWGFEEVELTDDFIQSGRGNLDAYTELKKNLTTYNAALANLFKDYACTELKDDIQALSDEALAENEDFKLLNADIKAMILKVKNNTWETFARSNGYSRDFEKFFRVRDDYQVYSHFQKMTSNDYCGMSNAFGKLSGPTGICGDAGDIIYLYVNEEPSSDCTLQVEVIVDSESPGDHQTGATTSLHRGLNAIALSNKSTIYIFYQLNNPEKFLENYPNMKIHIEGGQVQGYWDATRGMTNADWMLLREKMLKKSNVLNLKTQRLVFAMRNDLVQNAIKDGNEMEGLMRIWNNFIECEEDLMGFKEDLQGRFRNVWNAFSVNHGYMYASTYGTYYENSTLSTVMSYKSLTSSGGAIWGPSHEIGHNHQSCINIVGATEVSNNLFSNVNVFLHGISTTRGSTVTKTLDNFAKGTGWFGMGIWEQTRMYYQLYLYFHAQGHKPDFYPTLFKMLRKDPILKRTGPTTSVVDGDGNTVTGVITYGKDDYLHMAKKMCDAAQLDLSELFEVNGMFVPYDKYFVGDYSNYWVTTTEKDIEAAKAYMHRYPKAPSICFIDDRITTSPSSPDGPFEGKPSGSTRVNYDSEVSIGYADVGQWSDFVNEYQTNGYYYTVASGTYTIYGTGAIGFKVYDKNGNLVYLSNKKKFSFPSNVKAKVQDGFTIVACEANGYEVLVPFAPATYRGEMTAYYEGDPTPHTLYYYGTGTAGKSGINPLPVNSIAYIKGDQDENKQPTEELLQMPNVVSAEGVAQQVQINGDKPFYIPMDFTPGALSFTKSGEGYQALRLPFDSYAIGVITKDGTMYWGEPHKVAFEAGRPVVFLLSQEFNYAWPDYGMTVYAGTFTETKSGYILSPDFNPDIDPTVSLVYAENISPFTYVWENPNPDGIERLTPALSKGEGVIYDLSGRKINCQLSPVNSQLNLRKGIYIINGKKILKQ